jgi:pSer/pThr/pTyr-binding forkhead associated (FHA) protein
MEDATMSATLTLTVTEGKLTGQKVTFSERGRYLVGRASCCHLRLPSDADHWTISRFHCILDIYPPDIRLLDMGSRNGTFLNGERVGQVGGESGESVPYFPERLLHDGDEIRVGNITFRATIEESEEAAPAAAVGEEELELVG